MIKTFKSFALGLLLFASIATAQQNTLVSTSLTQAINATSQTFLVASATGITASPATLLYVDREAMLVIGISSTTVTVARGQFGTPAAAHVNAAMVLSGRPDWFTPPAGSINGNPLGVACTTASTYVTPYINIATGKQYLCSTVTLSWVVGFGNTEAPAALTLAVASAAAQITPSGPLFISSGTAAVTGFNYPIGMAVGQPSGGFCQIPSGAFTWTTANNIAIAGTAVVNRVLCWTWDKTNAKWIPSYV